jgi:hypothetical protein
MLQKDHGDGKIYSRKDKKWLKENWILPLHTHHTP